MPHKQRKTRAALARLQKENDTLRAGRAAVGVGALFITDPHGAQALRHTETAEEREGDCIGNQLFTLADTSDGRGLTLTGEELDSLCAEWGAWKLRQP